MGLLDGDIAALMGSVMGTFYLDGTLRTNTFVDDGMGGGEYTSTTTPVKYQEDSVSEETRVAGGYSQDDVRFLVLQKPGVQIVNGDSELVAGGRSYMLRTPRQDPAKSYWEVWGVPA